MMLPEFNAARLSWRRWHDHPASLEEQRTFGRRWRWTALWESIWDQWLTRDVVIGSLDEFVVSARRFWHPLASLMRDPVPYDPTIEGIWQDVLGEGPQTLVTWAETAHVTWQAMNATPGPMAEVSLPPTKQSRGKRSPTSTGDATADALLAQWLVAMREHGVSKSYSGNLRRYVVLASNAAGVLPEALDAQDRRWNKETQTAILRYQSWQAHLRLEEGSAWKK
ncbi:hypothetical protein [Sulfobacillus sp. hq2]|uniref:hypothetical protein n=1 Tax=Sulfobacillus TaxID=28033 RepID=UPI00130482E3|nr:hypothetical protein [Sulfobacillus sp. hq2]